MSNLLTSMMVNLKMMARKAYLRRLYLPEVEDISEDEGREERTRRWVGAIVEEEEALDLSLPRVVEEAAGAKVAEARAGGSAALPAEVKTVGRRLLRAVCLEVMGELCR